MAKSSRQRAMPKTPRPEAASPAPDPAPDAEDHAASESPAPAGADRAVPARPAPPPPPRTDAPFLVRGTRCVAGHERGHEFDAGRIGQLPTRRTGWIGVGLVLWCTIGLAFVIDRRWISLGLQLLGLWLLFSAITQFRLGHRRRCWLVRSWRHALGGLVPGRSD